MKGALDARARPRVVSTETGGPRKGVKAALTRSHTFPAGWQLVSVPLNPVDASPTAVFDEVPAPLRLYDYADGQELAVGEPGFRTVTPGRAFWLLLRKPVTVAVSGDAPDPKAEYRLPLRPGWNGVATPWAARLGWSDARVSVMSGGLTVPLSDAINRGWVEGALIGFEGGAPTTLAANAGAGLAPWSGYKLFSQVNGELVLAPPPPSTAPPQVLLATPAQDGDAVTAPTPILGTVEDEDLAEWRLEYAPAGASESEFRVAAEGTHAVAGTALGTFDPTLLLNGLYALKLTAVDFANHAATTTRYVTVRGNLKVGSFSISYTDLEVPLPGLPIRVTRTYDSRDVQQGDFGKSWRLQVTNARLHENDTPALGWQGISTGGDLPSYCIQPKKPHVVTVTLPDGSVLEFEGVVQPQCQPLVPPSFGTMSYRPRRSATRATLTPAAGAEVGISGSWPGELQLFDLEGNPYDPDVYRLEFPDGRALVIHQRDGLQQFTDLNGNALTFKPDGILHSSGRGVTFQRDALGRIESITDPEGRSMTYGYDPRGRLTSYTDRGQATATYGYDDRDLLDSIRDPTGKQPLRNEYDDAGRLVRHIDAYGKAVEYTHDIQGRQEQITDREGGTRLLVYDDRGNVLAETNAEGETTLRTFDDEDRRRTVTDPLKNTTEYTYEGGNLVSVKDPEGHVSTYTYNARGQVLTMKDPRGKVTENVYDSRTGNLTSTRDAEGQVTEYTYDARGNLQTRTVTVEGQTLVTRSEHDAFGNLTREVDAAGHATTYTYDRIGNQTSRTTTRTLPDGRTETLVTTSEYDRNERLLKTTDPDGTSTRRVYDSRGLLREAYDKRGMRTSYDYDDMARLVKTTFPDGTTETSAYNAEGWLVSRRDRGNRTTTFEYDRAGRPVKTLFPDSTSTETAYDDAGRIASTRDARGKVTRYEYDKAGRRTKSIDPLGNETVTGYDANGNPTSIRDPKQQTITYEYDALNRQIRTVFADGSSVSITYDSLGQPRVETGQGRTTRFDYDAVGRLTKVTDTRGQETTYGYDELGNRIRQTDANGHTTRFEYDALGRETARVLPDGKRETQEYDAAGNRKTRVDFMGRTTSYEYDDVNRLTRRLSPDGQVQLTYTAAGHRNTVTDARGMTLYTYDNRDRLGSLTYPDGRKLEYAYDGEGNRTTLTAHVGGRVLTTTYAYDDAGRLDVVTDPLGRAYDHGHDANGNRETLAYPNRTSTRYTYDALNRLKTLTTTGPLGTVQSYAFTLGPAGNRERIDEHDGTSRQYTYDSFLRLTGEKVTLNGVFQYEKTFTYDDVGNRLTQVTKGTGAPGGPLAPGSVSYSHDERDRLLTEAGRAFTYDDNGNLTSKAGQSTYTWDSENRLIQAVDLVTGTRVEHAYDADGARVQTRVTPATGPAVVTNFLVDTSGPFSHVVAEADGAGALRAYYLRGNDLLAVLRPEGPGGWSSRFYHADGLGSVRRLTDEAGNVTDGYTYSAYGELLAHTGTDPQPYTFTGEPYDPNLGLSYHRARWMAPSLGRFTSMDPWRGNPREPVSLHPYAYAAMDPVNLVDPPGSMAMPLPLKRGQIAHWLISKHYAQLGAHIDSREVAAFPSMWRTDIRFNQDALLPFGKRWPGTWGEVYEIKSRREYWKGLGDIAYYIEELRRAVPATPWKPGELIIPMPPAWPGLFVDPELANTTMFVRLEEGGVIIYWFQPWDPEEEELRQESAFILFKFGMVTGIAAASHAQIQMQVGLVGITTKF